MSNAARQREQTLHSLAKRSGVKYTSLYGWCAGKSPQKKFIPKIKEIAESLGLKFEDLWSLAGLPRQE